MLDGNLYINNNYYSNKNCVMMHTADIWARPSKPTLSIGLFGSQCPWQRILMKIWILSQSVAQQLPTDPQRWIQIRKQLSLYILYMWLIKYLLRNWKPKPFESQTKKQNKKLCILSRKYDPLRILTTHGLTWCTYQNEGLSPFALFCMKCFCDNSKKV